MHEDLHADNRLDRRTFIKMAGATGVSAALFGKGNPLQAQTYRPIWESIDTRPTPAWYQDEKFGIFIHWGVYSVPAYAPLVPGKVAYAEWYWHQMLEGKSNPKAEEIEKGTWDFHKKWYGADYPYYNFAPQFRAELFNPEHWANVLAGSGARYVVLTSKHHDGFALWPSKEATVGWTRPWNAVDTGPKRDVLADLSDAVRNKNVRMGYYYSLYEWYNPLWLSDKPRFVREHTFPQFKDLVTRYKPEIIFSDGDWEMTSAEWRSPELLAWLFNESPVKDHVVVNDRWGSDCTKKHGTYWATEYTAGMGSISHPWEECRGMGLSFGFNRAEHLKDYHTSQEIVLMLADTVSRGGNLLLDIGPHADGTIPVFMEERLTQVGSWLRINGDAIYGTKPWKSTRQWSDGEMPKEDYTGKGFNAIGFNTSQFTSTPQAGKAGIEALFTSKDHSLYAILPRWPESAFRLKDMTGARAVTLLGYAQPLKFTASNREVVVNLPDLPVELRQQPAWVVKFDL